MVKKLKLSVLRVLLGIVLMMSLLILAACNNSSAPVLYIGGIPDQNQMDQRAAMDELARILSESTGLDVRYREVMDYAAVVRRFQRGEIHLAWFGGLTGVQARNLKEGSVAVAQRIEDIEFLSVFIAGIDAEI